MADAHADQPAVGLQLGFARSARADCALGAFEVLPLPTQPWQQVLVLRKLHLQRRLAGARAAREDVEDQRAAVQHLDFERRFEVQLLRGRKLLVEDHERVARGFARGLDLLELARADPGRGVGTRAPLQRLPDDGRARGAREPRQLAERLARRHQRPALVVQAHEEGALLHRRGRVSASVPARALGSAVAAVASALPRDVFPPPGSGLLRDEGRCALRPPPDKDTGWEGGRGSHH